MKRIDIYSREYTYQIRHHESDGKESVSALPNKKDNIINILTIEAISINKYDYLWSNKKAISKIKISEFRWIEIDKKSYEKRKEPLKYSIEITISTMPYNEEPPTDLTKLLNENGFSIKNKSLK